MYHDARLPRCEAFAGFNVTRNSPSCSTGLKRELDQRGPETMMLNKWYGILCRAGTFTV